MTKAQQKTVAEKHGSINEAATKERLVEKGLDIDSLKRASTISDVLFLERCFGFWCVFFPPTFNEFEI